MITISSPMPGKISKILVNVGDPVTKKTAVMTHEAMKMENTIFADNSGVVKEILVNEGDVVKYDQPLLTLG